MTVIDAWGSVAAEDDFRGMKVVILPGAGGLRIAREVAGAPKPGEIGGRPILWHIMKSYAHCCLRDFVICLGYRGHEIKEYFLNYCLREFGCHARPSPTTLWSSTSGGRNPGG